ncbi:hypothetical protein GCM10027073_14920 [Streptomyces chlorus]
MSRASATAKTTMNAKAQNITSSRTGSGSGRRSLPLPPVPRPGGALPGFRRHAKRGRETVRVIPSSDCQLLSWMGWAGRPGRRRYAGGADTAAAQSP